jgi:hypothetical protein
MFSPSLRKIGRQISFECNRQFIEQLVKIVLRSVLKNLLSFAPIPFCCPNTAAEAQRCSSLSILERHIMLEIEFVDEFEYLLQ